MPSPRFRFHLSHVWFCIGFPLGLYLVCNALTLGRLVRWFPDGGGVDLLAFAAYLLAGLCLFIVVFTLLAHRWTVKPLAAVLIVTSAAATYFIAKYGVAIDSSMIRNAVHTDATEVGQLLSTQMIPYALCLVVLPLLLLWRTEVYFAPPRRYLLQSLGLALGALALALAALYAQYGAIFRAGNVSNKYIVYSLVPINVISGSVSVASKAVKPLFQTRQQDIAFSARVARPGDLVVVLAVGESSRRANFSLYGYDRVNTTPVLSQVPDLHRLNGIATRASTLYALPKILEKNGIKLTTITSRAGVTTACYVNYTLYDNCEAVGEVKVRDCAHGGKCYDEDVIPLLQQDLSTYRSGYRFLVLHLGGGSHGPMYGDRHPPEFLRFQPPCTDADVANRCTREQLYNSYDNTILYVDHVLGRTIETLEASGAPYVLIYLSDHGESLLEDGMMFHGVPPGMALPAGQAEIPLLVKASVPISVVARERYDQPEVFDTVLDLLSVESPSFDRAGSFIRRADSPPR